MAVWPCIVVNTWKIKCQLDATDWLLLQNLLSAQHVSGTIIPIIRSSRVIQMIDACGKWRFGLQVVGLVWSCRLCALLEQHPATRSQWPLLAMTHTVTSGVTHTLCGTPCISPQHLFRRSRDVMAFRRKPNCLLSRDVVCMQQEWNLEDKSNTIFQDVEKH